MAPTFNRFGWLVLLAALILLAYVVPFVFLSSVERVVGAFAFWTVFGAIAVAVIIYRTSRWKV